MNVAPIVMVKNEERFIQAVLRPLVAECRIVVVGDTGSTDATRDRVRQVQAAAPGLHLLELGPLTPAQVGTARFTLSQEAGRLGAEWILVVDGDELYTQAAMRSLVAAEMPTGAELGFTTFHSIEEDAAGQCWLLADRYNRAAVNRADVPWRGVYPFEAPEVWLSGRNAYHYFVAPAPGYHAVHLHRLRRSSADAAVHLRQQKQYQFSMRDVAVARVGPFDLAAWAGG